MYILGKSATSIEFLSEIQMTQFIACKNYDEKITTIHTCKSYYDTVSMNQESNQQQERQVQKNKKIKRILVVDDEYDVSLTIKLVLEENGFKVDSFTDASEVLGVILDVKMPGIDGFSLYKKLKNWMIRLQSVF